MSIDFPDIFNNIKTFNSIDNDTLQRICEVIYSYINTFDDEEMDSSIKDSIESLDLSTKEDVNTFIDNMGYIFDNIYIIFPDISKDEHNKMIDFMEKSKQYLKEFIEEKESNNNQYRYEQLYQNLYGKIKRIEKDYEKSIENLKENSKEENKKITGQFVSILGIFSAVVLAFNGGFSMITSSFSTLNSASIYRITFLITLIGFILFNTVMVLLVAISKFNTYKISSYCGKAESDVCFEGKCDKKEKTYSIKTYHCKLKRRYSYVYYINLTFLFIMYFTIGFKMLSDNIISDRLPYWILEILRSFLNDKSINFIYNFMLLLVPIFIILIYNCFKNKTKN